MSKSMKTPAHQGGREPGRAQLDWLDYQLENDPRFLQRIEESRQHIREGRGVRLEDIEE